MVIVRSSDMKKVSKAKGIRYRYLPISVEACYQRLLCHIFGEQPRVEPRKKAIGG